MATQWTAGLSALTPLPAATLNTIGAAWETWTPTYSASSGSLTTITTNAARYARLQKIVIVHINATVSNVGTASGFLQFTLPITAQRSRHIGVCREIATLGHMGAIDLLSTTTGGFILYAAGNTAVANYQMVGNIVYEAA